MNLKLHGKRVLITGASKGIGRAVAEAFAQEGCALHLAARTRADLEDVAAEIQSAYDVPITIHARDLSKLEEIEALDAECGDIDILVNNAGDIPTGTLHQLDSAAWRRGWDLKVFGFIDLSRLVTKRMYARKSGVILNIIGLAAEMPTPHYIAGCTGNAALNAFSDCLAGEAIRHGVRVIAINPGPIMSDRHKAHVIERAEQVLGDGARYLELEANYPAGRSGYVEEVAHSVVFLASERAAHINGASLRIDAGLKIMPRRP
jgi:hypothetical protein